jgi:ribosome-binding protein aMBF1 (putative translation factor)
LQDKGKSIKVITCDYSGVDFQVQLAGVKNEVVLQAFGQHLRQLREARGWSQQVLADEADISKPTIYRIETARYSVTLDVLVSLAQALEIPLAELVSFVGPIPRPVGEPGR